MTIKMITVNNRGLSFTTYDKCVEYFKKICPTFISMEYRDDDKYTITYGVKDGN